MYNFPLIILSFKRKPYSRVLENAEIYDMHTLIYAANDNLGYLFVKRNLKLLDQIY